MHNMRHILEKSNRACITTIMITIFTIIIIIIIIPYYNYDSIFEPFHFYQSCALFFLFYNAARLSHLSVPKREVLPVRRCPTFVVKTSCFLIGRGTFFGLIPAFLMMELPLGVFGEDSVCPVAGVCFGFFHLHPLHFLLQQPCFPLQLHVIFFPRIYFLVCLCQTPAHSLSAACFLGRKLEIHLYDDPFWRLVNLLRIISNTILRKKSCIHFSFFPKSPCFLLIFFAPFNFRGMRR